MPLPITSRVSESGEDFAKHIHSLHDEARRRIVANNDIYWKNADSRRKHVDFQEGDIVLLCLKAERFRRNTYKKLHPRRSI